MFSGQCRLRSAIQIADLIQLIGRRQRHYLPSMEPLLPPAEVRGMTELQRERFAKTVSVPVLVVPETRVNYVLPPLKTILLKMERLRPLRESNAEGPTSREILLHPGAVKSWQDLPAKALEVLHTQEVTEAAFSHCDLTIGYENFRADEILRSVLPADREGLSAYSIIGHIVHLNLRDHLLPYKALIGQVLLDKVPGCRTVVNKTNNVTGPYRNLDLELVCGVPEYVVVAKEHGMAYEMDFSRVYWNPRLSTEHNTLVSLTAKGDVLYDVFAGIGPFSVPAAKKGVVVLANDLNPESFAWLQRNMVRNKAQKDPVPQLFNKDGRDFLLQDVKADLRKRWAAQRQSPDAPAYTIHITMNLPAMAVEFLPAFRGMFTETEADFDSAALNYPLVHVYTFARAPEAKENARALVEQHLGTKLTDSMKPSVEFVRNVAPKKDMFRVSFYLNKYILVTPLKEGEIATTNGAAQEQDKEAGKRSLEADEQQEAEEEDASASKMPRKD